MMSESRAIGESARRVVVVADDEPMLQLVIGRVLTAFDLVPLLADDGAAAIAAVEAHLSELCGAILDIMMPGVDGIDAAHAIQRLAPELAIVLMSSLEPADYANRIEYLHLAGTLQKPFPLAALRALIRQVLADGATRAKPMETADLQSKNSVDASYG
jgi:CheY-like chemotaxis protein